MKSSIELGSRNRSFRGWRLLMAGLFGLTATAAHAAPVAVGNFSFETPQLGTTGTTWSNALGTPWTGTSGTNNGNAFIEYIAGFFSNTPTELNNRQHIGVNQGYDVWQDIPTGTATYQAGNTYSLTVAVGNRSGTTNASNASTYGFVTATALPNMGTLIGTNFRNASTVTAGTFGDAPAAAITVPTGSPLIGQTIRTVLQARGVGRSHYDNVRLDVSPTATGLPGAITADATGIGVFAATLNGSVTDVGSAAPTVTVFYGTADVGPTATGWASNVELGAQSGAFTASAGGLSPATIYFYRVRVTNGTGTTWSTPAHRFTTATLTSTPVTVGNFSFEYPDVPTTGTTWSNAEGAPWQEPVVGGGDSFVEYIANFRANAPDGALNDQALGMVSGYNVWQDVADTYTAGTGYILQVAVGNRSGFTDAANASTYGFANPVTGGILDSRAANASQVAALGSFADASAAVMFVPPGSPEIGKTIRVQLMARGPNRTHFDNIRLGKFTMDPNFPGGYLTAHSGITSAQATINGTVSQVGSDAPVVTIFYGTADQGGQPSGWTSSVMLPGTHSGNFTQNITGFAPGQQIFYRARFANSSGTTWSMPAGSFTTPLPLPTVDSHSVANITPSGAEVKGFTTSLTGADTVLYYGTADQGQTVTGWSGSVALGNRNGAYVAKVTGLTANTTYFYRWAATNNGGTAWSTVGSFTTGNATPATVATRAATNVDLNNAELNGEVTNTGMDTPSVTFYWGTTDGANVPASWTGNQSVGTQAGKFSLDVTGLTAATQYYFTTAATNAAGTAWGTTMTFTTDAITPPTVENSPARHLTSTLVTLAGQVTSAGDETPTVSFYWGDNDGDTTAASWDNVAVVGLDSGDFQRILTGLTPGTVYYFRAHASNSAGAAWAPETATFTTPASDAASALVISEVFYDPINPTYFTEYVEIHNPTAAAVDLTGWRLAGDVNYTFGAVSLAAGDYLVVVQSPTNGGFTTATGFDAAYPAAVAKRYGPWTRTGVVGTNPADHTLRNNDSVLQLVSAAGVLVDDVELKSGFPWPTASKGGTYLNVTNGTTHANSYATALLHPGLDNSLGGSWRSSIVTPAAANGTASASNGGALATATLAPPAIRGVEHTPNEPKANDAVVVIARITDMDGVGSASLQYQTVDPGIYIRRTDTAYATSWTTLPMNDAGTDGDAFAGDSVYTATIPASVQTHRRLVRYRVTSVDSASNSITVPHADDEQPNFAYFVYNGTPAWQGRLRPTSLTMTGSSTFTPPVTNLDTYSPEVLNSIRPWTMIAAATDVLDVCYTTLSTPANRKLGTLVYDGKVYDHIRFGNRGIGSTFNTGKTKWGLFFNRARNIEVRDNWGKKFDQSWNSVGLDANAYPWTGVHRGASGVEEATAYRAFGVAGVPSLKTTYVHWRVVDGATEVAAPGTTVTDASFNVAADGQHSGDFWGLYMALEPMESNFLKERNLPNGSIFAAETTAGNVNGGDKKNQGPTQTADTTNSDFLAFNGANGVQLAGQTEAWYRANVDLNSLYTFMAVSRLVGNTDVRPGDNWRTYRRPTDNRWVTLPYDMDMMFIAAHHWGGAMDGIPVAGAPNHVRAMMRHPAIAMEYRNRCREVLSLLASDGSVCGGQLGQMLDEYAQMVNPKGQALTWADADAAMWNLHPRTSGAGANTGQNNGRGQFWRSLYLDGGRGNLGGTTGTTTWVRQLNDPDNDGFSDLESQVGWFTDFATNTYPSTAVTWSRKAVATTNGVGVSGAGVDSDVNRQKGYGYKYLEWEGFYGGYFNSTVNPTFATPNIDLNASGQPVFPDKPVLLYSGAAAYPANDLRFVSGDFVDPDNSGIAAVQFRVGQISAPGLPGYDATEPRIYEMEELWTSAEIPTTVGTSIAPVRVPASSVRVGSTYRARVRHKDATGRWSYWSEPIQFVVGLPDITVYNNSLVISEVNYNPAVATQAEINAGFVDKDQFEFIELKNITNLAVDLTDVRFTKGVDVDLPASFSIPANGFALVVRNLAAFQARYGTGLNSLIAGTFTGGLDNGGEQLKLSYGTGTAIRDFVYDDVSPWPTAPDGSGPTMVLDQPTTNPDHGVGGNWRASYLSLGSPGADDVFNYAVWATQNANTAGAPNADPDHDGIDNRLEFAFGGDPNVENSIDGGNGILPTGEVATDPTGAPAGDYLTITFTRPNTLSGVTYTPQFSTDLTVWQGGMVSVSSTDNGDGSTTEIWRTPATVAATTRYFIHVEVTVN